MATILETVVPVFLIILFGFLIGKFKKINVGPLVDLLVYVTVPALIVSSITKSSLSAADFFTVALSAAGVIFILGILAFFLFKALKSTARGLYLPLTIGNSGYLGYPVALLAFGVEGLSRAVVFDVVNSLFLYSIGIWLIHEKKDFRGMFKIPLLYAVILGIGLNLFQIQIHPVIAKPLEMVGSITIPLALLVLGYKLTEVRVKAFLVGMGASLFRIIGGFLAALLLVSLFSISGVSRNIVLLEAAMPSAVMTLILCQKYGRDADAVASVVFLSTAISMVSIPLILSVIS
ncbi:AEC family transporter [Candidatus Woesearchaeota archaeon]|nr:AEC family transporter [Candidatus Woesearchaeota archaeon]